MFYFDRYLKDLAFRSLMEEMVEPFSWLNEIVAWLEKMRDLESRHARSKITKSPVPNPENVAEPQSQPAQQNFVYIAPVSTNIEQGASADNQFRSSLINFAASGVVSTEDQEPPDNSQTGIASASQK